MTNLCLNCDGQILWQNEEGSCQSCHLTTQELIIKRANIADNYSALRIAVIIFFLLSGLLSYVTKHRVIFGILFVIYVIILSILIISVALYSLVKKRNAQELEVVISGGKRLIFALIFFLVLIGLLMLIRFRSLPIFILLLSSVFCALSCFCYLCYLLKLFLVTYEEPKAPELNGETLACPTNPPPTAPYLDYSDPVLPYPQPKTYQNIHV